MPYLAAAEAAALDTLVARIEARTGVQIATAVVRRSDAYTELPWKAFGLGASLAAFALVLADARDPQWVQPYTALVDAAAILLSAASAALVAMFVPAFARLLLRRHRADVEVRRYAESLFFRRRLFRTHEHAAILILVSVFERRIEIIADEGLDTRVTAAAWTGVISRMTPHLRGRRPFDALKDALEEVDALLAQRGFRGSVRAADELPNRPIEEGGV